MRVFALMLVHVMLAKSIEAHHAIEESLFAFLNKFIVTGSLKHRTH